MTKPKTAAKSGEPTRTPPERRGRGRGRKGEHRGGAGIRGGQGDTWVDGHAAAYVVKIVYCGKKNCSRRHGPYKYLTWRDDRGRVHTRYAGRA